MIPILDVCTFDRKNPIRALPCVSVVDHMRNHTCCGKMKTRAVLRPGKKRRYHFS